MNGMHAILRWNGHKKEENIAPVFSCVENVISCDCVIIEKIAVFSISLQMSYEFRMNHELSLLCFIPIFFLSSFAIAIKYFVWFYDVIKRVECERYTFF